jgi:hypothetical protein
MGADGVNSAIDNQSHISLDFLPDSIKEIVSNKRFIIYEYGHNGTKWCLIYEEADSYSIKIGTTRKEPSNLALKIDTANLMDQYKNLICWGMDTLPYATKEMVRKYPKQWSGFYRTLSVFDQQLNCIFNSNNAIGFEGFDNMAINDNFLRLSYLMLWLSTPENRSLLPGFEDYIK